MRDGNTAEVDAFRFWMGDRAEARSSVWKIWEYKNQIYVSSRMTGGKAKLSVHGPHPSGNYLDPYRCQYGYERDFRESHNLPQTLGGVPMFVRWKRHQARDKRAHLLARIQFSGEWLRQQELAPKLKKKKFGIPLAVPRHGKIVEILLLAAPRTHPFDSLTVKGPATHLCHMPLGDSEVCLVLGRYIDLQEGLFPSGFSLRSPTALLSEELRNAEFGKPVQNNSALVVSHPNDFDAIRMSEVSGIDVAIDRTEELSK